MEILLCEPSEGAWLARDGNLLGTAEGTTIVPRRLSDRLLRPGNIADPLALSCRLALLYHSTRVAAFRMSRAYGYGFHAMPTVDVNAARRKSPCPLKPSARKVSRTQPAAR